METSNIDIVKSDLNLVNTSTPPHENYSYGLETALSTNKIQEILSGTSILFIDSTIEEYETLIDRITQATDIIILDSQRDGIVQITESLQQYNDLDAIHIVSHGDVGELSLGNTKLNQNTLNSYADDLISWRDSIADDGDILLYGCNVAEGAVGKEFIEELSQYTAADILASTDLTGSEDLGGDWDLEYATGDIEKSLAFDAEIKSSYQHTLVGSSFTSSIYLNNYIDVNFPEITGSNLNFNLGTNINLPDSSELNNPANINLEKYDFDNPVYNRILFNFDPSQINFNATDFDYNFVDIDNNSISFGFTSGDLEFAPSVDSIESLEFDFDDYTFDFESKFSFEADSITFGKDKIEFEFDSDSLNFNGADLFSADNAHLFEYKFLNNEITLPNGEITFADLNASDFRALDYAFPGDELFDGEYYFDTNAIPADMNPFTDYVENGWKRGSDPHPLFDTSYYLDNNTDVRDNGAEPFKHYILTGYTDSISRDPHPLFDTSYYQDNNADVVRVNKNPWSHYVEDGYTENFDTRDPNRFFDSSYYNAKNPDVVKEGMIPLVHYTLFGWQESRIDNPKGFNPNRDPSPFFDTSFYFDKHTDVRDASYTLDSANPVQHGLEFGIVGIEGLYANENRISHPLFESEYITTFTTFVDPNSEDFEFYQDDLNQYGVRVFPGDDDGILVAGITDEAGGGSGEGLFWTVVAGGIYRLFNNTLAGQGIKALYNFISDRAYSTYSIPEKIEGIDSNIFVSPAPTPGQIEVRVFPRGAGSEFIENFTGGENIFVTPIEPIEDISSTNTTFPQRDEVIEGLLNGGLFLGGEETPQGSYFYASGVTVQGSADLSEEIPQAIRLGQLEGGGTIRFSEVNKSRGIEGYFIPSGTTQEKPFSLKAANTVGRKANLNNIVNENSKQIKLAGITDPVMLRVEVSQFGAEELNDFFEGSVMERIGKEGVFEKIYFDAADGIVLVDSTGVSIINLRI